MTSHIRRFLLLSLLLLGLCGVSLISASAQTASTATLSAPDTSDFPHLVAHLDVHDPSGAFVHGLLPSFVTLLENGVPVPASDLQEKKPGVQFVVAIGSGESFTIRDGLGITRYEHLLQGLLAGTWAAQPSGVDNFSLITSGGPALMHTIDPTDVRSLLEKYKPPETETTPSLDVLTSALQVASNPTPRSAMERAVLFITPPQPAEASLALQALITSAIQQNIRIYVWLVVSADELALPETALLRNLADQTRGAFFAFSHDEPVPDLESILEPLRYLYQVSYDSQVTQGGTQQLVAQVALGGEQITTVPQSFDVNLQPPTAEFVSLPTEITRSVPSQPTSAMSDVAPDLIPLQQAVSIQITFPDGYERSLTSASLSVDGAMVAQNTAPPFEEFIWDLRPYTQNGVHTLSVNVVDSLGLTGTTSAAPIQISVPAAPQGVLTAFSQKRLLIVGAVVLLSASILVLVLIIGGRIHPKPHPGQIRHSVGSSQKAPPLGYRERRRLLKDPVTQPVKIPSASASQPKPRSASWKARLPWSKPKAVPVTAIASLVPLVGSGEPTLPATLQIFGGDTTLGSDPLQASLVILDPSIERLHARIQHDGKIFHITDAGTVAGTWVNFDRVPASGTVLGHADIIHLGAIGFRFNLSAPGAERRLVITPLEPDE